MSGPSLLLCYTEGMPLPNCRTTFNLEPQWSKVTFGLSDYLPALVILATCPTISR